jgi:hypothetical protein
MKSALSLVLALAGSLSNAAPLIAHPFGEHELMSRSNSMITMNSVSASGTGCPSGTWTSQFSPDRTTLTVGFNNMQTYIGPGTTTQQRTRECLLTISLNYPGGSSSAVVDTSYSGFATLPSGLTATFTPTFTFGRGSSSGSGSATSINGGGPWTNGNGYSKFDTINHSTSGVSGCSTNANLQLRIRLQLSAPNNNVGGNFGADTVDINLLSQTHSGGCA